MQGGAQADWPQEVGGVGPRSAQRVPGRRAPFRFGYQYDPLLEEVAGPASELLLQVQAGFRLSADAAAFAGDDQGSESGGLRRAYIRVGGEFWPWRRPVKFYLEIGVMNGEFSLDTSYLTFPALPYVGDLQVGQLDPPMSIDALSSSFARPFMEKSLAVDPLVPTSLDRWNFLFRGRFRGGHGFP